MSDRTRELNQYLTPAWLAEAIIARYFPALGPGDVVLEPGCGDGSFLSALPEGVRGVGIEIDPVMAARAAANSGHQVICGDIRTASFPGAVTAVIGNPPFNLDVVDVILERSLEVLPMAGQAGFVLPAYAFQTPSRVLRYNRDWTIQADHLPRTVFRGLQTPLVFAMFTRDRQPRLIGFSFYLETAAVKALRAEYREILEQARGSVWRTAVVEAMINLGGEASLEMLYSEIAGSRPTSTAFWREKVRQVIQGIGERIGVGRYALPKSLCVAYRHGEPHQPVQAGLCFG
ncbi:MAG: methionine biosynthesis protein MetW [Salinisphaeraceae bacterium]